MTAVVTVLAPWVADLHETTGTPGCLVAPAGHTCCQAPATTRLAPAPAAVGTRSPTTTFACAEHVDVVARAYPSMTARSLTR